MLEEIGYEYKVTKIDIDKGEQFQTNFKKISPLSKIPVIIDHETAVKTREFIANDIAAWASYQPAFDKIVKAQPDLLD